jgi:prepilin-type N-terminal cleavage/methylation domain-containing protein/prepilin-type processing-associated H-X9-DG protein
MSLSFRPVRNTRNGFTLIELLVVIAIIAILAAILFPVFAQAREKARQTSCLSNQKQLGTAIMMYVQDYDETYFHMPWPGGCASVGYWTTDPSQPRQHWATLVYPYVKNGGVFDCPSFAGTTYVASYALYDCADPAQRKIVPFSEYGLNEFVIDRPRTMAAFNEPASIALVIENSYIYSGSPVCIRRPGDATGRQYVIESRDFDWYNGSPRHAKGMNFAFLDGHAKWARASDLPPGTRIPVDWYGNIGYYPVLLTDNTCTP